MAYNYMRRVLKGSSAYDGGWLLSWGDSVRLTGRSNPVTDQHVPCGM